MWKNNAWKCNKSGLEGQRLCAFYQNCAAFCKKIMCAFWQNSGAFEFWTIGNTGYGVTQAQVAQAAKN